MMRTKPTPILVMILIGLGAIISGLLIWKAITTDRKESAEVTIYVRGSTYEVLRDNPVYPLIVSAVEDLLYSADDRLRLAILDDDIKEIKSQGVALEIVYPAEVEHTISYTQRKIKLARILIPLEGKLANDSAIIIYGKGRYESGPFANRKGTAELKSLLRPFLTAQ